MKFKEKHKQFAVKCYARFMKRSDVLAAFMSEFFHDVLQPHLEESLEENASVELIEKAADLFKALNMRIEATEKRMESWNLPPESDITSADVITSLASYFGNPGLPKEFMITVTKKLSEQLRRFDITHRQFPKKYETLFYETRRDFCASYNDANLQNADNIATELNNLYGYTKQLAFQEEEPEKAIKHVNLAHQLLKTLITYKALNAEQNLVDVTPGTAKDMIGAPKHLTQQLEKNAETTNGKQPS